MFDEAAVREELRDLCRQSGANSARLRTKVHLLAAMGVDSPEEALQTLRDLLPADSRSKALRVLRADLNLEGRESTATERREAWGSQNTAKKYEREGVEELLALLRASAEPTQPETRRPHIIALDDMYRPRRPVFRFEASVLINFDADLICRTAHIKTRLSESDYLDGWPWSGSKDEWWHGESPVGELRLATSRKLDVLTLELVWKERPQTLFVWQDNADIAKVHGHVEWRTDMELTNVAHDVRLFPIRASAERPQLEDVRTSLAEHNRKIAQRDQIEALLAAQKKDGKGTE